MKKDMVYGVTGLPCSGKSCAARLLAGGQVTGIEGDLVEADELGHAVLERPEVKKLLARRFGHSIAEAPDAATMRRRIANRVFNDHDDLVWLESVVHPLVRAETEAVMCRAGNKRPVVVEAALLFSGDLYTLCDEVLLIDAHLDIRMVRAAGRGWRSDELARREQRLLPLFSPKALARLHKRIIHIRNDADDGRLGDRIRAALNLQ